MGKSTNVKWLDKITNEDDLKRIGEERSLIRIIDKRKINWVGHELRRECLLRYALEGMMKGQQKNAKKRIWQFKEGLRQEPALTHKSKFAAHVIYG